MRARFACVDEDRTSRKNVTARRDVTAVARCRYTSPMKRMWMLLVVLWTAACGNSAPTPSITFTKIPPAAKGGPDVLDDHRGARHGRAAGPAPGDLLTEHRLVGPARAEPSIYHDSRGLHLHDQDASRDGVRRPAGRPRPSTARHARQSAARRRIGGPSRRRARRPEGETRAPHASVRRDMSGPSARRRAIAAGRTGSIRKMPGRMPRARCTCASPANLENGRAPK